MELGSLGADAAAPMFNKKFERAIFYTYNAANDSWSESRRRVHVEQKPFSAGSLRAAYHMEDEAEPGKMLVLKMAISSFTKANICFVDVKMQALAKEFAVSYNAQGVPKTVDFLDAHVVKLIDRSENIMGNAEEFVSGKYEKFNNNLEWSDEKRNTPQAFSHFTYEKSHHHLVVVDIQGVGDIWTDPQIHSADGLGFGIGNHGSKGIDMFRSNHSCNAICRALNLPPLSRNLKADNIGTLPLGKKKVPCQGSEIVFIVQGCTLVAESDVFYRDSINGVEAGDVLKEINNEPISSLGIEKAIALLSGDDPSSGLKLSISSHRNGTVYTLNVDAVKRQSEEEVVDSRLVESGWKLPPRSKSLDEAINSEHQVYVRSKSASDAFDAQCTDEADDEFLITKIEEQRRLIQQLQKQKQQDYRAQAIPVQQKSPQPVVDLQQQVLLEQEQLIQAHFQQQKQRQQQQNHQQQQQFYRPQAIPVQQKSPQPVVDLQQQVLLEQEQLIQAHFQQQKQRQQQMHMQQAMQQQRLSPENRPPQMWGRCSPPPMQMEVNNKVSPPSCFRQASPLLFNNGIPPAPARRLSEESSVPPVARRASEERSASPTAGNNNNAWMQQQLPVRRGSLGSDIVALHFQQQQQQQQQQHLRYKQQQHQIQHPQLKIQVDRSRPRIRRPSSESDDILYAAQYAAIPAEVFEERYPTGSDLSSWVMVERPK